MEYPEPDSTQTGHLLERATAGERGAFDELFARHRPVLRRFIDLRLDARLRSRVDPSDIVQETQLDAFRRMKDYLARRPMPFHLWLRKTAKERLLKVRRRHLKVSMRTLDREVQIPDASSLMLAQQLVALDCSPSQQLSQQEVARRVTEAVGQLADIDREVLMLRTFEQLSYQAIAYLLDIEPAAARKRYGRALLRLRSALLARGLLESES